MNRKWLVLAAVIAMLGSMSGVYAAPKKEHWEDEKYLTKQYSYVYNTHSIYFDDVENLMHIDETLTGTNYTLKEWISLYNAQMLYLNILQANEALANIKASINAINNSMVLNEQMVRLGMATSSYNSNKDKLITLQENEKTLKENRQTMIENLNELLGYSKNATLTVNPITEITFDSSSILTLKKAQKEAAENNFMNNGSDAFLDKLDEKVETIHTALRDSLEEFQNTKYAVAYGMDQRAIYNLQYELGMISKMNYEALIANLSGDLDRGNTKLTQVYKNYVEYRAAINGYIPSLLVITEESK